MTSAFRHQLADRTSGPADRRVWRFVPYDQLHPNFVPEAPDEVGVLLVECPSKARRRPYHRQKLALLLTNLRHFALELAERGVRVRHVVAPSYRHAVEALIAEVGPVRVARPAERELRMELAGAADLLEEPHPGWLTSRETFVRSGGPPWRMDRFYREVRRGSGLLMDARNAPLGGRFSFDEDNRRRWDGIPPAPTPPSFARDAVTDEVLALVARDFADHPGRLDPEHLPCTAADAEAAWAWALAGCLPSFGPYEDAMSGRSRGLFHTRISPLLNLHRLWPARIVDDVVAADLPLASKEGFVRQIVGWREFVRHVHEATDGFRDEGPVDARAGDGGFADWAGRPWPTAEEGTGGANPSVTGSDGRLPPAFWGVRSGMTCLDRSIAEVWDDGWTHHIQRLMVISNVAALLDVSPRILTDWFWVAFVDAYDWVVEPNVLAMSTYGVGDRMTTKPYVSGSAYIARMSDHCASCAFDPKRDCPIGPMYWAYLDRHQALLEDTPRMRLPLASLARRTAAQRAAAADVFEHTRATLLRREPLR